jgi:hypothetical protein
MKRGTILYSIYTTHESNLLRGGGLQNCVCLKLNEKVLAIPVTASGLQFGLTRL